MAAGLVEKTALISREWEDAPGIHAQAQKLRMRALPLADEDAAAYADVLRVLRAQKDNAPEQRDFELGEALSRAAELPLLIAQTAADVAELADTAAHHGNPNLRGDAAAAATLAASAARAAAHLVEINLSTAPDDPRIQRAAGAVAAAEEAAARALKDPC